MPRGKGNRTDLNLPKTAVPNQPYGVAGKQLAAESEVPMAASPVTTGPAAPATPRAANPGPPPGSLPYMGPTNRPNEPVTHGLPFGPGDGPEALSSPQLNIAKELEASAGKSSVLTELAATARMLGL